MPSLNFPYVNLRTSLFVLTITSTENLLLFFEMAFYAPEGGRQASLQPFILPLHNPKSFNFYSRIRG